MSLLIRFSLNIVGGWKGVGFPYSSWIHDGISILLRSYRSSMFSFLARGSSRSRVVVVVGVLFSTAAR